MRFASGTPLAGRYLLLDEIAAGPQAAVWRGMDDVLGRPVAVKLYLAAASDAAARAFIHARARTAARLSHPHATAVYDYGDAPGPSGTLLPYVVMELLDGEPLAATLPRPWPQAVRVAAEVAGALAGSHARNAVHGRLDTAAVMMTPTGAKLLGLAGPGQPPAVPPTPADDVRGLGVLLLDALSGPDAAGDADPTARLGTVPELPAEVADVCLACLAVAPEDRPAMADVARTLTAEVNRIAGAGGADAAVLLAPVPPTPPSRATWRWGRVGVGHGDAAGRLSRTHAVLAAAGTVAILVLSGVAVRYGDDLLTAATAPGADSSATSTDNRTTAGHRGTRGSPTGGGGATPPTTGGAPQPGTSGPPGAPTTGTTQPAPPAPSGPVAPNDALDRLRASVDEGRVLEEITPEVAVLLDEAVDDLVRRAAAGENIHGKVTALHSRIDGWVRMEDITPGRGADLHNKLNAYAGKV